MRRMHLPLVAIAALLLGGVGSSPAVSQSDVDPDVSRDIEVLRHELRTTMTCGPSDCVGGTAIGQASASFQESMGTVDVTVTMTLEYKTTPHDGATVGMAMKEPGERLRKMRPGRYFLRPGGPTTTSLTWVRRNVAPTSAEHRFQFALGAGEGAEPDYVLTGTEVVLLIEATPT